jgi:hypothetical protein
MADDKMIDLITGKPIEPWAEQAMSAKTDYRMNLAKALFEATYDGNLRVWSDATRDYWLRRADAAVASHAPTAPVKGDDVERLLACGRFLLDRLDELDFSMSMDDFAREHAGHVDPAIARFRAALDVMGRG